MAGISNEVLYGKNADFTSVDNQNVQESNGLFTNGKMWIGSTATNAGGTHINVGNLTSPDGSITFGYISPNITAVVSGAGLTDYHVARYIVSPGGATDGAQYTTLASAYAAAVLAGGNQTVFLQPGTYTENITLSPNVNITAFPCDAGMNGGSNTTSNVIINGTLSYSSAGTVCISNVQLRTNSAPFLSVTGSEASIVNVIGCYLNVLNNNAISYTTANVAAQINFAYCQGNIGTTGITPFVSTSTGTIEIQYTEMENSGASTTPSTTNATVLNIERSLLKFAITTTAANGSFTYSELNAGNATCLTTITSGTVQLNKCLLNAGTASAASIGASTTVSMYDCTVNSSNTNAVTGAGTLVYSNITFSNSSSVINTTTQTPAYTNLGKYKASGQPAFLAFLPSTVANVTGDGTVFQIGTTTALTEVFDVGSNFNTNGTFTAPVTGLYTLGVACTITGGTVIQSGDLIIVTTARSYRLPLCDLGSTTTGAAGLNTVLADMTAGDTATFTINTSDTGGKVDDLTGSASPYLTYVWGSLTN